MFRMLAVRVVVVLGLMALVVSAQQPSTSRQVGETAPQPVAAPSSTAGYQPLYPLPGTMPAMPPGVNPYAAFPSGIGRQGEDLVKRFARVKGDEREKIKALLTEALEKQFDARQKHHQDEIAALEAQVNRLKDLVQKRQENRREIINRRFEQLVRESEGLGW